MSLPIKHVSNKEVLDNSVKLGPKLDELRHLIDKEEYTLRKRLPRRFPKRKNDVYVSRRTNFPAQINRCQKLLESGWNEIYVHGLGASVERAANLALKLKQLGLGSLDIVTNTSTVELIDDLEPEHDDLEPTTMSRMNSAVHIKIFHVGSVNNDGAPSTSA